MWVNGGCVLKFLEEKGKWAAVVMGRDGLLFVCSTCPGPTRQNRNEQQKNICIIIIIILIIISSKRSRQ